ncbi:desulfoferrodoxin [Thermodesulfobacterium sp. TA1]|uniref:desulfoferrodoxin n=1 Tax=Thermodesulfobacterium sp. TA1 TaxID=2234087 RepID=UPI0012322A87|nr:desulfoferrodoxin [Thermodesulfobacterium sp. TA1]QER41377.1 desulfoferrodoxin [Thermodesulfobacterium sp. TA1]
MAARLELYKCKVCGNIVLVMHGGKGQLVCCGKPMELQNPNTVDAALEKHVPVIEKEEEVYKVKVGSVPHPMTEEHYIEWIELHTDDDRVYIKFLKPGEAPEAVFEVKAGKVIAKEWCNLHGYWQSS